MMLFVKIELHAKWKPKDPLESPSILLSSIGNTARDQVLSWISFVCRGKCVNQQ